MYSVVFGACLRNASAVAQVAQQEGRVAVIAAGERWADRSLRPAIEDLTGAGAVISGLTGGWSVDAELATVAFAHARDHLSRMLSDCDSGRELAQLGFHQDIELAAQLDVSQCVPRLRHGAFVASS
jgi:2-phosphosulfolactate phosphatase